MKVVLLFLAAGLVGISAFDYGMFFNMYTPVVFRKVVCRSSFQDALRKYAVAPWVYAIVESWRTPEVQRSKEPFLEICILLCQYVKEYSLGKRTSPPFSLTRVN